MGGGIGGPILGKHSADASPLSEGRLLRPALQNCSAVDNLYSTMIFAEPTGQSRCVQEAYFHTKEEALAHHRQAVEQVRTWKPSPRYMQLARRAHFKIMVAMTKLRSQSRKFYSALIN